MTKEISSITSNIKNTGLKVTSQRVRILDLFIKAAGENVRHMAAEDVYRELKSEGTDIALATVYRVLLQFEQAGLLRRHHLGKDQATFELESGEHHDHLICTRCGKIEEFVDSEIEARQQKIAQKFGFTIEGHTLSLYGICAACRAKENDKNK